MNEELVENIIKQNIEILVITEIKKKEKEFMKIH